MHIFGYIPFMKPENDTYTDKRLKTMKNERERLILFWLSFCSLFGAWKIVGINLPSSEQNAKTQPKQDKSFSFIFHRF